LTAGFITRYKALAHVFWFLVNPAMKPIILKSIYVLLLLLISPGLGYAEIELAPRGKQPLHITDVYLHGGLPYVAIDDVLDAVSLQGDWDSVGHLYRIRTQNGWAELSPGRQSLKIGENFYPLQEKPRFIDGRLRVSENFLLNQLSMLANQSIYYRNLNPVTDQSGTEDSALDRLFSFLSRKKIPVSDHKLHGVAIDVAHGGLDPGVIAANGYKEKQVTLALGERLSKLLKMNLDIPVYLSRNDDYEVTQKQRLAPVTHDDTDVWLLLHAQGSFSTRASGVTLFIRGQDDMDAQVPPDESRVLAENLRAALSEAGIFVVGIYSSPLVPLGKGSLPTVQIELGYLTNPDDLRRLESPGGQQQLAQALYQGLNDFTLNRKKN
jgi:N-acetylmuramoyl-L-alanine amidase